MWKTNQLNAANEQILHKMNTVSSLHKLLLTWNTNNQRQRWPWRPQTQLEPFPKLLQVRKSSMWIGMSCVKLDLYLRYPRGSGGLHGQNDVTSAVTPLREGLHSQNDVTSAATPLRKGLHGQNDVTSAATPLREGPHGQNDVTSAATSLHEGSANTPKFLTTRTCPRENNDCTTRVCCLHMYLRHTCCLFKGKLNLCCGDTTVKSINAPNACSLQFDVIEMHPCGKYNPGFIRWN